MANNGGIRISLGAVATGVALLAQFGAIVWWLSTEHAAQVAIQSRLDAAGVRVEREALSGKTAQEQRNSAQDAAINRLDQSSRKIELTDERLQSVARRVEVLERLIEEQRGRDEVTRAIAQQAYDFSRDTNFKLNPELKNQMQSFPPGLTWPPTANQQIGPQGGIVVGPGRPPIVIPGAGGGVPPGPPPIIQEPRR